MKVRITDPPQLKGDYPIDLDFTHGELHLVKKVTGLRGLEIDDGIENGDTDLFLVLGVIGAIRDGRLREADAQDAVAELMKTKIGSVRLIPDEDDEEAEEDDPKASAQSGHEETQNSSGETTSPPSDGSPETSLSPTGDPT